MTQNNPWEKTCCFAKRMEGARLMLEALKTYDLLDCKGKENKVYREAIFKCISNDKLNMNKFLMNYTGHYCNFKRDPKTDKLISCDFVFNE